MFTTGSIGKRISTNDSNDFTASRKILAACSIVFNRTSSSPHFHRILICWIRFWEADVVAKTSPSAVAPRVLYVINAGTRRAPQLVRKLVELDIQLTVTVGRDEKLHRAIEKAAGNREIDIFGWTDEMPRLLCGNHLLIGKAGGATVQETIAAGCPMIINHVVSGQEEGNARLIVETNSGAIALSNDEVVAQVRRAFATDAKQWHQWSANIGKLSRPRASLDIAAFLLSL